MLENKSVREVWQEIEKVMSENPRADSRYEHGLSIRHYW